MFYKNCRELPYHNFNEVQVENSFIYLIKNKKSYKRFDNLMNKEPKDFTQDELVWFNGIAKDLERLWIDLLDEYFRLTNDFSQTKFFKDRSELLFLETKKEILESLFKINDFDLTEDQRNQLNGILKKYRVTDFKTSILGTNDDINLKISQLKTSKSSDKKSNFEETLAVMRMNGVNVNRHEVTVSEFVAMINMMSKSGSKAKSNSSVK